MNRYVSLLLVGFLLFFSGCAKSPRPSARTGGSGLRVAMVTDKGGLGDQSFNDSAYRGLKKAESDLGAEIKVLESRSTTDYEPNLQSLADAGYGLIFAVGYLMADSVKKIAPLYPNVKFAIIDGRVENLPNVVSLTFKEQEGSFLAGMLAALLTKTRKIGFIGGEQSWLIEKFEAGYRAGARTANPEVAVIVGYTGSFVEPAKGKELALSQFSRGADIVFHASGACGNGVIEAAKERGNGVYAIGVDSDQDYLGTTDPKNPAPPGRVLTSMVKRVDVAVFKTIRMNKEGKFKSGVQTFGLKEDGVGLSEMKYTKQDVPPQLLKRVRLVGQTISEGKLLIPDTLTGLKTFAAPASFH